MRLSNRRAHISTTVALIPCYNVETYCSPVIEQTLKYVSSIILVDDGSTDGTGSSLKYFATQFPDQIHLIIFPQNRGKGVALLKGIEYALKNIDFHTLVTLDSDGQHLPEEIEKIASCIHKGAELAIGTRIFDQMPLRSRFANTLISFLLRLLYSNAPLDNQSGFRGFSKKFAEKIIREVTGERYEMEFRCILLALKDNDPIAQYPIKTIYLDKNISSHFSKIIDSYRILSVLFHYWRTKSL